jgi:hypothetical protein
MTLFNHLFSIKKRAGRKLRMAAKRRIMLWEQHLLSYPEREGLSRQFSYKNIDAFLARPAGLHDVMDQIEATISRDLVHIDDEEKLDHEIYDDMRKLIDKDNSEQLNIDILYKRQDQAALIALFKRIHQTLKTELHAIRLVRKNPANLKDVLLALFKIIYFRESELYEVFSEKQFADKEKHNAIMRMANAVLLEQEFKEALETDERRFVREMSDKMRDDSKHHYRRLAEDMYSTLAGRAGAPVGMEGDVVEGVKRLERLMRNDKLMRDIVKGLRPGYGDDKVRAVIAAFRKSYDLSHFMELEAQFAT